MSDHPPSAEEAGIAALIAADAASPLDAGGLADLVGRLSKAGRDTEASRFAARLLRVRPGHRRALRALARSPVAGVDDAAGWRLLADAEPADPEPWLQLARIAAREKNPAESLHACDAVLARAPDHPEGLARRIAALILLGRPEEAARTWVRLEGVDKARAVDALTRAAAGPDADAKAAMLGAAIAAGTLPASLVGAAEALLADLRAQVEAAAAGGDATAEVAGLWRVVRLAPHDEAARGRLAAAVARLRAELEGAGDHPPARLAPAARVLARAAPSRAPLVVLGRIAAQSLAWGEAADAFSRALAARGEGEEGGEGDDAGLWLELAQVSARRGRMEEALDALEKARAAGAPAAAVAAAETLVRGLTDAAQRAAFEREDARNAARLLDVMLAAGVDPARLADRAARLTRLIGRKLNEAAEARAPETVDLARLYVARVPTEERAWLILGRALLRERRDGDAVPVWERIAAQRPNDPEPPLQLARLSKRLNRPDLGAPWARRTLELSPGHAEAAALLAGFQAPAGQ